MDLVTVTEAANIKGVDPSRVRALISEGKLAATKYGKTWLIKKSDLEKVKIYGKPGRPPKDKKEDSK